MQPNSRQRWKRNGKRRARIVEPVEAMPEAGSQPRMIAAVVTILATARLIWGSENGIAHLSKVATPEVAMVRWWPIPGTDPVEMADQLALDRTWRGLPSIGFALTAFTERLRYALAKRLGST